MSAHIWMVEWRHHDKSNEWMMLYGQFWSRKDARSYIRGCEFPPLYRAVKYVRQGKPC